MHIKSRLISVASKKLILNVKMQTNFKVNAQNIYNANTNKKKAKVALI